MVCFFRYSLSGPFAPDFQEVRLGIEWCGLFLTHESAPHLARISTTLGRQWRSSRNSPRAIASSGSRFMAAIMRVSTSITPWPPCRCAATPECLTRSRVVASPRAVMKMIGNDGWSAASPLLELEARHSFQGDVEDQVAAWASVGDSRNSPADANVTTV